MFNEKLTYQQFGYYCKDLAKKSNKKVIAICEHCKKNRVVMKEYYRPICYRCSKQGKFNGNYKNGNYINNKKCINCNTKITFNASRCRPCADKFHSIEMQGSGNPAWIKDKIRLYPLGWTKTYKEQIRYRDGYKCQICDKPEIENCNKLDVHHIDYNKNNIKPNNLISLCDSCHMKTNANRDYWYAYCMYIMVERGLVEE